MDKNNSLKYEKFSTLGELAAVLAHEIKNPMNSIIINIEVLRSVMEDMSSAENPQAKEKAAKYLNVIEDEMKRLGKVISGFLDLAAPEEQTRSQFTLNSIVGSLVDLMRLEMQQKKINIQLDLDESLPSISGSVDQLKQAVLNLLLNSTQAMPDGGTIHITSQHDDNTLSLSISDTGHGISEEILNQVFSPYFTTKEKGSGLGLAIVRRIVRDHGGYVDVKSEADKGAKFSLVFPKKDSNS